MKTLVKRYRAISRARSLKITDVSGTTTALMMEPQMVSKTSVIFNHLTMTTAGDFINFGRR
jgi:hypothetical protein